MGDNFLSNGIAPDASSLLGAELHMSVILIITWGNRACAVTNWLEAFRLSGLASEVQRRNTLFGRFFVTVYVPESGACVR